MCSFATRTPVFEILIIAVENECKEVVVMLNNQAKSAVIVRTTNYSNSED